MLNIAEIGIGGGDWRGCGGGKKATGEARRPLSMLIIGDAGGGDLRAAAAGLGWLKMQAAGA
jgi:hypothetical protein